MVEGLGDFGGREGGAGDTGETKGMGGMGGGGSWIARVGLLCFLPIAATRVLNLEVE